MIQALWISLALIPTNLLAFEINFKKSAQLKYTTTIQNSTVETRQYTIDYNPTQNQFATQMQSKTHGFFSLFRSPYAIESILQLQPQGKSKITYIKENDDGEISEIIFNYDQKQIESSHLTKPRKLPNHPIITLPETIMLSIMHYLKHLMKTTNQTLTQLQNTTIEVYIPYSLYESKKHLGKLFKATYQITNVDTNKHTLTFNAQLEKTLLEKGQFTHQFSVQYNQHIYPTAGQVDHPKTPLITYKITQFKHTK